jgi:hypothetical protein
LAQAELAALRLGAGVQAAVTYGVLALGWDVGEDAGDEVIDAQAGLMGLAVTMAGVAEADVVVILVELAAGWEWAALDVASQVESYTLAVWVELTDVDVPMFAVELAHDGAPVGWVGVLRQAQGEVAQGKAEVVKQLAAKQAGQDLGGQEEVVAGIAPLAIGIEAAGGDQAVDVGVLVEVTAPGVQGHEDAGQSAEELGIGAQGEQALAGAVEEDAVEPGTIEAPQGKQDVRQGEDDVEVLARQKLLQLRLDPGLARLVGALGAGAMTAGVVLELGVAVVGAVKQVGAHGRGEAVGDGPGGAALTLTELVSSGVGGHVLHEDVLEADAHGSSGKGGTELGVGARRRGGGIR